jgi:hypothetical protein
VTGNGYQRARIREAFALTMAILFLLVWHEITEPGEVDHLVLTVLVSAVLALLGVAEFRHRH